MIWAGSHLKIIRLIELTIMVTMSRIIVVGQLPLSRTETKENDLIVNKNIDKLEK